jgi:hypothetical protein
MKHIKEYSEFINEQKTYKDLESDLRKTFEKTGIAKRCYNGEIVVGGSFWPIGHPNGSVNVTFWLMDKVPVDKLNKTAKEWAKKNNLIAATFYPDGIKDNSDAVKTQDWRNAAAQNAKYVYGFAFYTDSYSMKNVYKPLKESLNEDSLVDYSKSKSKILVGLKTNLLKDMKDRYDFEEDNDNIHFFDKGNHIGTLFDVGSRFQELRHDGSIDDKGYRINEDLNATISDPELEAAWSKAYGKEFKEDFPHIFRIMKQRAKMDSRELERIWNETHENSFKEDHPKVWNILFSK